jgi:hypothetical protein
MALEIKQLAQARENSTSAVSVFSPGASEEIVIDVGDITVCNNTASPAALSLYVDDDGTTYDATTILVNALTIQGNGYWTNPMKIKMNDSSGNIAYKTSVANALTITINGIVKT